MSPVGEVSPAQMALDDGRFALCPLLDDVAVEIRLMIFRLVLAAAGSVVKVAGKDEDTVSIAREAKGHNSRIDVSLLAVNRRIGAEARDVFFAANRIRLARNNDDEDELRYLHDLRNVELTDDIATAILWKRGTDLQTELARFTALPRLRTLTIDCGSLYPANKFMDHVLRGDQSGCEIACVRIGVYELKTPYEMRTKVFLKNLGLCAVLPEALEIANSYSLEDLDDRVWPSFDSEPIAWTGLASSALALSFAYWFMCYERARNLHYKGPIDHDLSEAEYEIVESFEERYPMDLDEGTGAELPKDVRLGDLTVKEHGEEMLDYVSEMLAYELARLGKKVVRESLGSGDEVSGEVGGLGDPIVIVDDD